MKNNRIFPLFFLALSVVLSACSLDIVSENKTSDPDAVVDAVSARMALTTAYSSFDDWKSMIPFTALSDDVVPTSLLPKSEELFGFYHWRAEKLIDLSESLWTGNYAVVTHANAVLERLANITPRNSREEQLIKGVVYEAKALKALALLRVLQEFSPRYTANTAQQKRGIVYKTNVKLEQPARLTLAQSADTIRALLVDYYTQGDAIRPQSNRWLSPEAARCIAAELELWVGNYRQVAELCRPVLNRLNYGVFDESVYTSVWTQSNANASECLFNIDNDATGGALFFDNWYISDGNFLAINDDVVYDESDARAKLSVVPFNFPVNYGAYYRPTHLLGKYNALRSKNQIIQFVSLYRYSDFVFMGAEAFVRTQRKAQAVALLNAYLKRRGAALVDSAVSDAVLLEKIGREKQKEFLGEGKRFFDLKRLGNKPLNRNLLFEKVSLQISPDDFRWTLPIPASEYRYNPNVEQNEGWKQLMPKPQE